MAVVSGYSVALYCDCENCQEYCSKQYAHSTTVGYSEFGGETFKECIGYAKQVGWKFKNSNTELYAPGHKITRGANQ